MKRIAIYEPESMVGGLQTWAYHLQAGFRALGHEADIVTFTRSGKPRAIWSKSGAKNLKWRAHPYQHVERYQNAAELLNGYDGVILNDPRSYLQDNAAKKGLSALYPSAPDYLNVLEEVTKPTTVAVHCSRYEASQFPYLEHLLDVITTSSLVVHSRRAFDEMVERMPDWGQFQPFEVPLPYQATELTRPSKHANLTVGLLGRYTSVKGHRVLAGAWAHGELPANVNVALWGGCDVFRGPAASTSTYETIISGHPELNGWISSGSGSEARPWEITSQSGASNTWLRYGGGYRDTTDIYRHVGVNVNLTTTAASGGALEYSQLESINAGCLQVAVEHRWDDRYQGVTLKGWWEPWPSDAKLAKHAANVEMLDSISDAITAAMHTENHEQVREHNYRTLLGLHDPSMIAQAYLDVLAS